MASAQKYLFQFVGPILLLIGSVGSILNLIVFNQKNLRKNPCSIYFIAYNLANFVYIYCLLFSLILEAEYNIDPSAHNLVICHVRLYINVLFNVLSPYYLILASIDRILVTSRNALTRQRSTRRLAFICVTSGTLFWALFHSHALIIANITHLGPISYCYFQPGLQLTFVGYYSVIKELLALSLMIICGLWAIRNIRSTHRVMAVPSLSVNRTVVEGGAQSTSSKDRQLALMLVMDIIIYTPFSFALAVFLMYQQITQIYIVTIEQVLIQTILTNIFLFIACVPFCTSFYANFIVSKAFRNEVKKVFSCR
jgi:hypothetical protein